MNLLQHVYAAPLPVEDSGGVPVTMGNYLPAGRFENLGNIFGFVINVVVGVGWALVFIMLALGFIQYVTSQGETKAADKARMWLTYAVIGGVGLFFLTALRVILPGLLGGTEINVNGVTNF